MFPGLYPGASPAAVAAKCGHHARQRQPGEGSHPGASPECAPLPRPALLHAGERRHGLRKLPPRMSVTRSWRPGNARSQRPWPLLAPGVISPGRVSDALSPTAAGVVSRLLQAVHAPQQLLPLPIAAAEAQSIASRNHRNVGKDRKRGDRPALQIDSHTKFAPGWDTMLVRMLRRVGTCVAKPVITTYPTGAVPAAPEVRRYTCTPCTAPNDTDCRIQTCSCIK